MPPEPAQQIVNLAVFQECLAHTLLAKPLLWPDFVLIDDLLLRKDAIPDDWEAFLQDANDAGWLPFQIEYVVNHVHLEDLLWTDPYIRYIDSAALDDLATVLAEMWRAKLKLTFPARVVQVEVNHLGNGPEVGVYSPP